MDTSGVIQKLLREISTHRKELKRVEEAFKRYQSIFDNIPVGIYRSTPSGEIIKANAAMAKIFGYESSEELMKAGSYALYVEPEERDRLKKQAEGKDINEFELQMKRKDGKLIWIRGTERVVKDEKGNVLYYDGFLEDITYQKEAEEKARELEMLFKDLAEKSLVGVYLIQDGVFKYVNPKLAEIFGYTPEELIDKKGPIDLTFPEDRDAVRKNINKRISGQVKSLHYVFRGLRKDGSVIYLSVYGSRTIYEGKPAVIGTLIDITEEREREERLRESEEKYRLLFEYAGDAAFAYNKELKLTDINRAACETIGKKKEELIGKDIFELGFLHPEDEEKARRVISRIFNGEKVVREKLRFKRKDGSYAIAEVTLTAIFRNGELFTIITVVRDITAQEEALRKLEESEELHRAIVENTHDGIYIYRENKFLFVNRRLAEITGYSETELAKIDIFNLVHPEDRERLKEYARKRMERKPVPSTYEAKIITKSGEIKILEFAVTDIKFRGKYAAIGSVRDVTERRKLIDELEEKERIFNAITDAAYDAIIMLDHEGNVVYWSKAAERIFGYSQREILGRPVHKFVVSERFQNVAIDGFEKFRKTGEGPLIGKVSEVVGRRKDGAEFPVELSLSVLRIKDKFYTIGILRDISERKKAHEKLQASLREKDVLLRELHHRVKNNLQIITSLLRLQSRYVQDPHVLNVLKDSQSRIKSIALLHEKFYRSEDLANVKFGDYIRNLINDLYRNYGVDKSRINLKLDLENVFLPIDKAIPASLVINELVSNSLKYAFPEGKEGTIEVKFKSKGKEVEIVIKDNGIGFGKDVEFDSPSTFGFRLVRMLVKDQLKGAITLNKKNGTEFRISFRRES